jgi:RNA polymerase sigma-70 factor (ECF subfamily)
MDATRRDSDLEALLRESAWVRGLARGLLGEGAAADDLAQDVLMAALDRRPGLEGSRLRGWLRTVARRLAGRSHERRGLREHAERASAPRDVDDRTAGHDADRDADRRVELQHELTAALGELEPSDRTVLVLRYFDGRSTGELARHLGLAEPAARKRVSRALERLRARLDARSGGDRRVWSAAIVAALAPRSSDQLLPVLPTATLLAGLMTKTIWTVAALGVVCVWLVISRPWIARPSEEPETIVAIGPELAELQPIADKSRPDAEALAQNERIALAIAALDEEPAAARVRVVDANGLAVPVARAAWLDLGGAVATLELDPDGSAPLPEDARGASFFAVAEGHGLGAAAAASERDDVIITLPPTHTLTGRVIEDDISPSEPLSLRHLSIFSLMETTSLEVTELRQVLRALEYTAKDQVVLTDPDGRFILHGLTVGVSVQIGIPTTHMILSVDGRPQAYMLGRVWVTGDKKDVEIKTARLPGIRGRMVWEDTGDPLVGTISVYFLNKGRNNSTQSTGWLDEHGFFSLGVPIEPHALEEPFEMRGAALTERSVRVAPAEIDGKALPFEHNIELTDVTFPLDVGTIRVPRAPVLYVRLIGPNGAPVRGAIIASDLARAITDADGRVCIAARHGPLQVLANDCALSEFEVPEEPTSADAPLELRPAPGATLELLAHHGSGPNPWGGRNVRIAWIESPFEGARFDGPGQTEPLPNRLYMALFGVDWNDMRWEWVPGMPGHVSLAVPMKGPLLVPGWRAGGRARVALLDAADQPLVEVELRVPDAPGRFTANLSGSGPDTGRLLLSVVDAEGRSAKSATITVRAQGEERSKWMEIEGSTLDLAPVKLGLYDVTVRVSGFLEQQLQGLEATPNPPERKLVLAASRRLNVALVDEAGQALRASALELRGEAGRWNPSLTSDQVAGWCSVHDLPRAPLELTVVVGTRTWTRSVDAEQTTLSLDLPVHGRLVLSVHARELLTGDDGYLVMKLRELDGEGSIAEEASVDREGVGPTTATFDLLPGRYELSVDLEEYENPEIAQETDERLKRPLVRREVEVRAREHTEITVDRQ